MAERDKFKDLLCVISSKAGEVVDDLREVYEKLEPVVHPELASALFDIMNEMHDLQIDVQDVFGGDVELRKYKESLE